MNELVLAIKGKQSNTDFIKSLEEKYCVGKKKKL